MAADQQTLLQDGMVHERPDGLAFKHQPLATPQSSLLLRMSYLHPHVPSYLLQQHIQNRLTKCKYSCAATHALQ